MTMIFTARDYENAKPGTITLSGSMFGLGELTTVKVAVEFNKSKNLPDPKTSVSVAMTFLEFTGDGEGRFDQCRDSVKKLFGAINRAETPDISSDERILFYDPAEQLNDIEFWIPRRLLRPTESKLLKTLDLSYTKILVTYTLMMFVSSISPFQLVRNFMPPRSRGLDFIDTYMPVSETSNRLVSLTYFLDFYLTGSTFALVYKNGKFSDMVGSIAENLRAWATRKQINGEDNKVILAVSLNEPEFQVLINGSVSGVADGCSSAFSKLLHLPIRKFQGNRFEEWIFNSIKDLDNQNVFQRPPVPIIIYDKTEELCQN